MKNWKIKQKWNSLPWSTRDMLMRTAASLGAILALLLMVQWLHEKREKADVDGRQKKIESVAPCVEKLKHKIGAVSDLRKQR